LILVDISSQNRLQLLRIYFLEWIETENKSFILFIWMFVKVSYFNEIHFLQQSLADVFYWSFFLFCSPVRNFICESKNNNFLFLSIFFVHSLPYCSVVLYANITFSQFVKTEPSRVLLDRTSTKRNRGFVEEKQNYFVFKLHKLIFCQMMIFTFLFFSFLFVKSKTENN